MKMTKTEWHMPDDWKDMTLPLKLGFFDGVHLSLNPANFMREDCPIVLRMNTDCVVPDDGTIKVDLSLDVEGALALAKGLCLFARYVHDKCELKLTKVEMPPMMVSCMVAEPAKTIKDIEAMISDDWDATVNE